MSLLHGESHQVLPVGGQPWRLWGEHAAPGTDHFLGSQGVHARSALFSGLSYTELLLFWPQKSILVVPGWYLTPESPQPQAGTPPTSSLSKPRPLQHSLLNPRQWGVSPALGAATGQPSVNGLLVPADWAGWSQEQMVISLPPQGPLQLRSGPQTAQLCSTHSVARTLSSPFVLRMPTPLPSVDPGTEPP